MKKSLIPKTNTKKQKESLKTNIPVSMDELDSRIALIQALIPLGLKAVEETLQHEVSDLAGERYSRGMGRNHFNRWRSQRGSVYLADQKIPVDVPRIRDTWHGHEVRLTAYERLQRPRNLDEGLLKRIVNGLSCRNYRDCAEAVPEAFGLSASTVSRRTIRATAQKLEQFQCRSLKAYDFVALFLDGKCFAKEQILIALGVTIEGEKIILGFLQASTENEKGCTDFLRKLIDRGLAYDQGLLCVIDGSKGLRKAIQNVFGDKAAVQRCRWHKRENVVGYLPKSKQPAVRKNLQDAYQKPTLKRSRKSSFNGSKRTDAYESICSRESR